MATTSAYTSDNVALSAIDGSVVRANPLELTEYELSVPADATIDGIVLTWTGNAADWDEDDDVMYISNGAWSAPLSANTAVNAYGQPIGTTTFGEPGYLWGLTWTPESANSIATKFAWESGTGYHDAFQITIYYTATAVATASIKLTSGLIQLTSGKISI